MTAYFIFLHNLKEQRVQSSSVPNKVNVNTKAMLFRSRPLTLMTLANMEVMTEFSGIELQHENGINSVNYLAGLLRVLLLIVYLFSSSLFNNVVSHVY